MVMLFDSDAQADGGEAVCQVLAESFCTWGVALQEAGPLTLHATGTKPWTVSRDIVNGSGPAACKVNGPAPCVAAPQVPKMFC